MLICFQFLWFSNDILLAELTTIYHALIMVRDMGIEEFVCYSDPLHIINLINNILMDFHVYAALIQDIKDLINHNNVSIHHTLCEGNQCADFLAKLEAY